MDSFIQTKQRPTRLFFDEKKKHFYVMQNGKRAIVKVPKDKLKTGDKLDLKKAQTYILGRLQSKLSFNKNRLIKSAIKPEERVYFKFPSDKVKKRRKRTKEDKEKETAFKKSDRQKLKEFQEGTSLEPFELTQAQIDKVRAEEEEEKEKAQKTLDELKGINRAIANLPALMPPAPAPAPFQLLPPVPPPLPPRPPLPVQPPQPVTPEQAKKKRKLRPSAQQQKQSPEAKRTQDKAVMEVLQSADEAMKAARDTFKTPLPKPKPAEEKINLSTPADFPAPVIHEVQEGPGLKPGIQGIRQTQNMANRETEFKNRINKLGLSIQDVPNFDTWNGPKATQFHTNLLHDTIKDLSKQSDSNLFRTFQDQGFQITANDSKSQIIKKVLAYLTPNKYNELVEQGKLQGRAKIPNAEQIGKGNDEEDEEDQGKDLKPNNEEQDTETNNPLPALWDEQIEEFFKDEPQFAGVIASDQIEDLPNKLPMGFVMNRDASDQPGSHWIGVYISGDSVEYFDPLADPPSKETIKDIHNKLIQMKVPILMKFKVNKIKQQHGNSHHCGYHVMRFLDDRFAGIPFPLSTRYGTQGKDLKPNTITNNTQEGEKIIKEEFKLI